jgi:hypothetical protein
MKTAQQLRCKTYLINTLFSIVANHQCPKGLRILAFRPLNEKVKNKNLSALCVFAVN